MLVVDFSLFFSTIFSIFRRVILLLTQSKTTNFRLFQTQKVCRRHFRSDENGSKLSKRVENTVEKEKLLVTSNFSFSHSVFKRIVSQGSQKVSLCGNGLRNEEIVVCKCNEILVCKCSETVVCKCNEIVVCKCNETVVCKCSEIVVCKCNEIVVCKCFEFGRG